MAKPTSCRGCSDPIPIQYEYIVHDRFSDATPEARLFRRSRVAGDQPCRWNAGGQRVRRYDVADLTEIIGRAEAARHGWAARTAKERSDVLRSWYNLICEHAEDLARLMTLENGKPLDEARGEVEIRRGIHRMVLGRGSPRLWRSDPAPCNRQADRDTAPAGRDLRRDHALEFPAGDDHPQSRAGACGRLFDHSQAGEPS